MRLRPGLLLAAAFLCLYGALALTVDVPKAAYGFKSDEATYYMIGLSLVHDGDLAYRKEDLARVWREYDSGPAGVFLKHGQKIGGAPDPDQQRYFYGKSFIYPLVAAPLVLVFGTNGFLLLNAIAAALVLLCAYLFLHARSDAAPSAVLAGAFVMASSVPVYLVQIMPEVFNFSLTCLAYFCWLYKEVAAPERSPRGTAWLFTPRSDLVSAILLGIATFSKPTIALLFAAPVLWGLFRVKAEATRLGTVSSAFRRKILFPVAAFALVAGGLFAVNMAITGAWNYQGGDRRSYYVEFPFQTDGTRNELGVSKSRETLMTHVVFNPRTFASNLAHNLEYFFVGRHAGLLAYFFPGFFAMIALVAAAFAGKPRGRPRPAGWQWLVLASALAQGLIFVVWTPYTWSGGGVGNRYFFGGYGVMLFLLPAIESLVVALVPWIVGGLFVSLAVLNPFAAAAKPADIAKHGPLRLLPVELTLLNDLPVMTEGDDRARVWFGDLGQGDPGFLVTFLDDNAYGREPDRSFWTRGDSRAELVFKANAPIRRAVFTLTAGPVPVDVRIDVAGRAQAVHLESGSSQQIATAMPSGLPYEKEVAGVQLWKVSIATRGGFTPIFFEASSSDTRYLGVKVRPMLELKP
ncbi:MAG TPA: hypothetical protein VN716_13300 [Vicinamibacterales bacterium]|nr:hypothetical protein [Vicinamibacterales bacterium]